MLRTLQDKKHTLRPCARENIPELDSFPSMKPTATKRSSFPACIYIHVTHIPLSLLPQGHETKLGGNGRIVFFILLIVIVHVFIAHG